MKPRLNILPFLFLFVLCGLESPLISQERFRKSPPYPEPLPKLKLPPVESATLSNGLALSVIYSDNLPFITLRLIILGGESASPDKFPGTATFTANMLNRGTLTLSFSDIEEKIESIGGHFSSSTFPDYSMFTFTFSEEYLDEALDVLSKMILQPAFSKREIDNVRRSMFYDLVKMANDSESVAKRQLFDLLFKGHPYQQSIYNEDVVLNINQNTILSFFDKFYRPNNARLILIGNLNLSTASRKVSRYLNTWQRKDKEFSFISSPKSNEKLKICFVDIPHEKDATIYMGNIISPLSNDEFFPLLVLNQVLGGTPTSRLFMNLRESKGYAYYAFSEIKWFKACGIFFIREKVRPEVTYAAVMETLREIERTAKEKMPSFEIEQAKSYLIGNFPLKIETLDNLSLKVAHIQAFQRGEEHWSKYYENIMLIDSKKVFETAQNYPMITPVVVIAGDKNILIDHLREFDEVEVYNNKGNLQYSMKKESSNETR